MEGVEIVVGMLRRKGKLKEGTKCAPFKKCILPRFRPNSSDNNGDQFLIAIQLVRGVARVIS